MSTAPRTAPIIFLRCYCRRQTKGRLKTCFSVFRRPFYAEKTCGGLLVDECAFDQKVAAYADFGRFDKAEIVEHLARVFEHGGAAAEHGAVVFFVDGGRPMSAKSLPERIRSVRRPWCL